MSTTLGNAEGKKQADELIKKWGKNIITSLGWTAVPNILLERQQLLKLDAVDMNILLVLLKHWWTKPDFPYPSKRKIGDIINRSQGTVQTHIRAMEKEKLITRKERFYAAGGQSSNEYDLSGLIKKLDKLAKEEIDDKKSRKESEGRKQRGKPG
jgi:predicted transcriptional regulator